MLKDWITFLYVKRGKSGRGGISEEEGVIETKGKKRIGEGRHERKEVGEGLVLLHTRNPRERPRQI